MSRTPRQTAITISLAKQAQPRHSKLLTCLTLTFLLSEWTLFPLVCELFPQNQCSHMPKITFCMSKSNLEASCLLTCQQLTVLPFIREVDGKKVIFNSNVLLFLGKSSPVTDVRKEISRGDLQIALRRELTSKPYTGLTNSLLWQWRLCFTCLYRDLLFQRVCISY
jgi:hypothetical protein